MVIWELSGTGEERQRRGLRLIGYAFAALALYLLVQSTVVLARGYHPHHSVPGIIWTAVTAAVMFALAAGKARTGRALGNPVLQTEGRVTLIDGILATAVLLGLVLNAALGWWWADPARDVLVVYAAREVREIFFTRPLRSAGACAADPGQAACLGQLLGQGGGDFPADRIGVPGGQARIHPAFDLDPQRPPGPPGPGMGVQHAGHRPGRRLRGGDDRRVDAVGEAAHDIGGDLVADVADDHGDHLPRYRSPHGCPEATAISPASAPADDSASSHECRASATSVAELMRLPTTSL